MYKASQEAGGAQAEPQADPNAGAKDQAGKDDGEVTDVDFEEVK